MPNFSWNNPVMINACDVYSNLYGENASTFINILEDCPYEVAVISRLAAYLNSKMARR